MEKQLDYSVDIKDDDQAGKYITFQIGTEMYGLPIRNVAEIIGLQQITEIPDMPSYIKGITNLRGIIIPLMDIRLRFGMSAKEYDDRTCIIVIDFDGSRTGLIVDCVSEVMSISDEEIVPLQTVSKEYEEHYISNIGKTESGTILILDCEKLLAKD